MGWVIWATGRRQWQPTPVLLPGESHGWRSLVGCSPWGHGELDTTGQLHFHFHALEKEMVTHSSALAWRIPGTGGAWWAAVYGVAQSQTRLKRLSSSSSSSSIRAAPEAPHCPVCGEKSGLPVWGGPDLHPLLSQPAS